MKSAGIGPVILNGRPDRGMPKFAMTADFRHCQFPASFDLRGGIAAHIYKVLNILIGNPKAGEILIA